MNWELQGKGETLSYSSQILVFRGGDRVGSGRNGKKIRKREQFYQKKLDLLCTLLYSEPNLAMLLFVIVPSWKPPKCTPTAEWINTLWCARMMVIAQH